MQRLPVPSPVNFCLLLRVQHLCGIYQHLSAFIDQATVKSNAHQYTNVKSHTNLLSYRRLPLMNRDTKPRFLQQKILNPLYIVGI